jgi:competence protein ComGF
VALMPLIKAVKNWQADKRTGSLSFTYNFKDGGILACKISTEEAIKVK